MTQTILFVDEERFIHKALRRSFRKMRDQWDMRFVNTPSEAMESLKKDGAVDILITEMIFSGENGLDLLRAVRDQYPKIVRIVLSGYIDREVVLKTVDLAHQYLSKPCDDRTLQDTIARAFMMKDLLVQDALKEIVARIDSLPSLPSLYVELIEELKSEDASIEKVGDIIAKDLGITTKILKLVNSSFFGMPQRVSSPAKAVSLLGLDLIKAIVLTSGTFDKFKKLKFPGFSLEQMWQHAMITAAFAQLIAKSVELDRRTVETVFMAGLLHDIGKLLIAAHLPTQFMYILAYMKVDQVPMAVADLEVLGTTHAAIGAYLLGLWGLPGAIIDATAFHHSPEMKPAKKLQPHLIVHVANAFANAASKLKDLDQSIEGLDCQALEKIGSAHLIAEWRRACVAHYEDGAFGTDS